MEVDALVGEVAMAASIKILFVDDEPAIRATLPQILRLHGFDVTSAANVTEALQAVSSKQFDVLISDLNIGSPGDGFTVVSAMRRTQPTCVTLILTGYPAFETALEAIRSQVDDYLIKPAGVQELVNAIEERLRNRSQHRPAVLKRVPQIIMENEEALASEIVDQEFKLIDPSRVKITREECKSQMRECIRILSKQLASGRKQVMKELLDLGVRHGRIRYTQGYSAGMLVEENRIFCHTIHDCVHRNLLIADVSHLVPDLTDLSDVFTALLREAVSAHSSLPRAA
jgi:DNA-binding response OmpR family regulator